MDAHVPMLNKKVKDFKKALYALRYTWYCGK